MDFCSKRDGIGIVVGWRGVFEGFGGFGGRRCRHFEVEFVQGETMLSHYASVS